MQIVSKLKGTGLYYCYSLFRKMKDKRIKNLVLYGEIDKTLVREPGVTFLEHNENGTEKKLVCIIKPVVKAEGFFATYRRTLDALYFADCLCAIPVVRYSEDFLYSENGEINGSDNPFEYYFKPTSSVNPEEAVNYIMYNSNNRDFAEQMNEIKWSYKVSGKYIKAMGDIAAKYVIPNGPTSEFIKNGTNELIGNKKVLGVHIRGTDYRLQYKYHPSFVSHEDYFYHIDEILKKNDFENIFLATDDSELLELFKEKYGSKIVYYEDVVRGNTTDGVHICKETEKNKKYRLGLEVIRDVYTLAECDGLVCGMSQVSMAAQIVKASKKLSYSINCMIDKGISQGKNIYKL